MTRPCPSRPASLAARLTCPPRRLRARLAGARAMLQVRLPCLLGLLAVTSLLGWPTAALASDAAAATDDPIEVLRQRLAERLAGNAPPGAAKDLRIVVRPGAATQTQDQPAAHAAVAPARSAQPVAAQLVSPGHSPAAAPTAAGTGDGAVARSRPGDVILSTTTRVRPGARSPTRQPAKAGTAGHDANAQNRQWGYLGPAGPQAWGALRPEFNLCGAGQRQSPIDLRGGLAVDLEPVQFDYQPSRFSVIDNGHTVQARLAPGNAIVLAGRRFELQHLHFHRPSEERIDGRQFEMSAHLVHKDDQGRLAIVAVLLDKGPAQPVVQTVWNNLPLEKHDEMPARALLDLSALLPADARYYTYMGSMTTPPCSEGVQWVVMRQPVTMAPEQIDLFSRIYPMNARPVQQASGRRILQSQ